jgi:hypothetical protein
VQVNNLVLSNSHAMKQYIYIYIYINLEGF